MSSANIGWLFYKDYFKGLDYKEILDKKEDKNSKYIESKVAQIIASKFVKTEEEILGSTRFQGTTSYPGLILGSGNAHEVPSVKGQAILGFHFDYTSGLPVIAGSSIKGVLRSAFKHPEYIQALLDDADINVEDVEKEIFNNADVFFDAYIIKADAYERILGDDYLTPHADPLKDPIPLRFIKVLPDVTFLFQFEILDKGILSKYKKAELFQNILGDLGLGAKTNVGYGKLENFKKNQTAEELEVERLEREKNLLNEALLSKDIAILEKFMVDFPKSDAIDKIKVEIETLKFSTQSDSLQKKFDELDKKNKKYLQTFIEANEKYDYAAEIVIEANKCLDALDKKVEVSIEILSTLGDAKSFKTAIASLKTISDDDKVIIAEHAKRIYLSLKGKKQKNCFKEMQLGSLLNDKVFESGIKESVGAK